MRLVSWNVNGLRACVNKGFKDAFKALDADFFCLQETKMQAGQLDLEFDGYRSFWNYADKKGYSGTAVFTRQTPLNVTYGLGIDEHDHEGRVITIELDNCHIVTCYTPNSQDALRRLDYRKTWDEAFQNHIRALDKSKPVIFCGDLNVAHEDIDLKNPKTNHFNPGFTDEERMAMSRLLGHGYRVDDTPEPRGGFTDTFRLLHPNDVKYSWWSYRFQSRAKNIGWRIDYFIVSERLSDKVKAAEIHTGIEGSDHCPVSIDIDI